MRYFEVYAWTECPFCIHAKELLIREREQFMFCCLDQSDKLLSFLKEKYNHHTVPLILLKNTTNSNVRFIGGYTDLVEFLGDNSNGQA